MPGILVEDDQRAQQNQGRQTVTLKRKQNNNKNKKQKRQYTAHPTGHLQDKQEQKTKKTNKKQATRRTQKATAEKTVTFHTKKNENKDSNTTNAKDKTTTIVVWRG